MPEQIWPKASAASMAYSGALARSPQGDHATELATVLHRQAADLFPGHFFSGGGQAHVCANGDYASGHNVAYRHLFWVPVWGDTPEDDVPVCNHPQIFPFSSQTGSAPIVPGQHSGGHGCWLFGADPDDPGVITSFTFI